MLFIQKHRRMCKAVAVLLCTLFVMTTGGSFQTPAQAKTTTMLTQASPATAMGRATDTERENATDRATNTALETAIDTTTTAVMATTPVANSPFEQEAVPAWVPTLHRGSRGWHVSRLQWNLKRLGFYPHAVTGYYGPVTRQCVKNFQWRYSIHVDGIAGRITQGMINHALVKQRIIYDTYRYRGVPYVWGGKTPAGFDCSGFIYYMFRKHGVYVSYHTSRSWFRTGYYISRYRLRPGDLVFFAINRRGVVSHVGLYMGNNKFVSATSSKGIAIYSLSNPYWAPHYMGARRVY